MSECMDQLMRLLSARATDWLRLRLEHLPAPLPKGHPDLAHVAAALGMARVLSDLLGRPSLPELLLRRHLHPALVGAASLNLLSGSLAAADLALVVHGASISPGDPLHHLAAEALAADPQSPLHLRLRLRRDAPLLAEAEAALAAALPVRVTGAELAARARLLMALWGNGSAPRDLASRRTTARLHERLQGQAAMAADLGCTEAMALSAVGLGVLGDVERLRHHAGLLLSRQASDGSFLALADGPAEQRLPQGLDATMAVLLALHLAVLRRWRGPSPAAAPARPLHDCLTLASAAVAARILREQPGGWLRLRAAAVLCRSSGADWFARLSPPRLKLKQAQLACLAEIAFPDPLTAMRLRAHLGRAAVLDGARLDWLAGRPVALQPLPESVASALARAAARDDEAGYLRACRRGLRHAPTPPSDSAARLGRRLAGAAHARATDPATPLPTALAALERLILLATVTEGTPAARMVA